jgi:Uma2 family endonuclease
MGVQTAITIEEYLHSSFPDLDREYWDGEIVERSLPDYLHGKIQGLLVSFFIALPEQLRLFACTETRMRLPNKLVLVPDVAVFHREEPKRVPDTPSLVAIEILSADDRLTDVREKLEKYRSWGVPHVWLVDPQSRRFYTCDAGLTEVASLSVPELGIAIQLDDVFKGNAIRI